MSEFDAGQFQAGFLVEAEEHLRFEVQALLSVEGAARRGEASPKQVRELFRSLHTLKGLAAMIGVDPIVALAHGMENVLRLADRGGGRLSPEAIERLLQGVRAIEERVGALGARKPVPPAPNDLLDALGALEALVVTAADDVRLSLPPPIEAKLAAAEREQLAQGARSGQRVLLVSFLPTPERAAAGHTISAVRERLARTAEIVRVLPMHVPPSDAAPGGLSFALLIVTRSTDEELLAVPGLVVEGPVASRAPASTAPEVPEGPLEVDATRAKDVVRVEVSRLDDAIEKLGLLVVGRHRLRRAAEHLASRDADVRELRSLLLEQGNALRDLRGAILRARMVPVAEVLERVPLMVRSLMRSTGKQVQLDLDAGDAELDKSVAERVFPAIVHLVRNAIDHGIERPDVRRAAGKPPAGLLRIAVHSRGDQQLSITVQDDGAGIDPVALARRAGRELPPGEAALLDLLCTPGFSTRDAVTETSGRGVGMEIVRRVVETELGGELRLSSSPGRGTSFTMGIPLTLTIVDAFTFLAAGQAFAVPVGGVEEILSLDGVTMMAGPGASAKEAARLLVRRGETLPLVDLAARLELSGASTAHKAIVVRREGLPFAFGVERMLGQQELVVRPLEDPLVRVPGVSGAADLGDGIPTLMLDLAALAAAVNREAA